MEAKWHTIIPAILVVAMAYSPVHAQQDCKLTRDKDGIKIYTCHTDTARFKFVKAEILLNDTRLSTIRAAILDVENYVAWQYNLMQAEVLEHVSDTELVLRTVVDAPWPVTNRELITRLHIIRDIETGELEVEGKSIKYDLPLQKQLVRVPFSETRWSVAAINDSDLIVHYALYIDPGGSVPSWLVNLTIAEGPYQSFRNLKKLLQKMGHDH